MSVLKESYTLKAEVPSFINIEYRSIHVTKLGPVDINASLWFERSHLPWLIDALQSCLTIYGVEDLRLADGDDLLKVSESGPEPAPFINLNNKRLGGAPHAGLYWVSMTKPLAQQLLEELRKLVQGAQP